MVCHDMMGGYKEDHLKSPIKSRTHCYRFNHWGITDYFVYFSHHRVSIPPPSYTNVGHSHGTKVLGTIITEGLRICGSQFGEDETTRLINGLISKPDGSQVAENKNFYANKLVELCKFYGFDGYLLNIETNCKETEKLKEWVSYLREKLHEEVPGSVLVWYDSVTTSGSLQWQSCLNKNNQVTLRCFSLIGSRWIQ